jgi:hypothetical protein
MYMFSAVHDFKQAAIDCDDGRIHDAHAEIDAIYQQEKEASNKEMERERRDAQERLATLKNQVIGPSFSFVYVCMYVFMYICIYMPRNMHL